MWDESAPSVEGEPQPLEPGEAAGDPLWTDGQLIRLENEWRRAQRSFAYHPSIGIAPLRGDPPHEYRLDFRVRTLVINEAGELQYVDSVSMHVWLPPGFPNQPPVVRPMVGVFHPNVVWEGVYITNPWQSTDTLVEFAARIGELLAFRNYDPQSVVNAAAMDWLEQNSGALPLDTHSDFDASADGEPLGRIMRLGPGTLEQIRRALDDMRFALVAEHDAPSAAEVEAFARDTRAALNLFLDNDIPEKLREQASEFDNWCRELPASVPLWDYLRRQRTAALSSETAVLALRDVANALEKQFQDLAALVNGATIDSAESAAKAIPPMAALAPIQLALPPLARDFEQRVNALRAMLDLMKTPPPHVTVAPEGSLGRRLASQADSVQQGSAAASKIAQDALTTFEPLRRQALAEVSAVEQVVGWREYMDMFAKAHALEQQVATWGSAGVHAYFIENSSGSFGPFQFEEPLDLGGTRVAIRNMQGRQIDAIDAVGLQALGNADGGTVSIIVGQTQAEQGYDTAFRLTDRCDDLAVQFDFIGRKTADALAGLQRPVAHSKSWCGKVCSLLASQVSQQNLRVAHRKSAHRWKALILDLGPLLRFKERLATYHLLMRMTEATPRVKELIVQARARHADATQKIAVIMSKSSRDVETDRMIIPPKYARSYSDEMQLRDEAKHEVARLEALLKQIARELAVRLSSPRYCGRPELPSFHSLAPLPDSIAQLREVMGDGPLQASADHLSRLLGVQLPFNPPPVPQAHVVTRPASPGAPARGAEPTPAPGAPGDVFSSNDDVVGAGSKAIGTDGGQDAGLDSVDPGFTASEIDTDGSDAAADQETLIEDFFGERDRAGEG
ncbi:MAG TPA: hypothetical protein VFC78_17610 [Tepidisphaeraceae bacterium]|nr:hypothetical protein [Tepidisphaeraceae bacterium]